MTEEKRTYRLPDWLLPALIIIAGALLRFYHLSFQSLWLDELHTAIESDPKLRDQSLHYFLTHVEQQPPLFFWLEQFAIKLLGNSEFSLRLVPALAGTAGIAAIYFLGKELKGRALGLYAAALMAVNFFCISYSQEARPYTLVVLFSILSWTAFIRFIKSLDLRRCLWYVLPTLVMLYTNYFGMLVFGAQMIVGCIVLWNDEPRFRRWFGWLALAGGLVAVGFAPLLPLLRTVTSLKKFWATTPEEGIGIDYFFSFFGPSDLLKPFLLLLLISFFLHLILKAREERSNVRSNPLLLLFVMCTCWIFVALLIPFVRSWLVVPMMVIRYSATLVTAFILLVAAGLEAIRARIVKALLLGMFIILSITHLFVVADYYHAPSKEQFRELTQIMTNDSTLKNLPAITGSSGWHQSYYLKKFHYTGPVFISSLQPADVRSIIARAGNAGGFWYFGGHTDQMPAKEVYDAFDSGYIRLTDARMWGVWGQLFVTRSFFGPEAVFVDLSAFAQANRFLQDGQEFLGVWGADPVTCPVSLKAGDYKCVVVAYGTPVKGIYPRLHCSLNGSDCGWADLHYYLDTKVFNLHIPADGQASLGFWIDNDASNDAKGEDRNAVISKIIVAPASSFGKVQ